MKKPGAGPATGDAEQGAGAKEFPLDAARDALIRIERLAGLGALAAGVSHEIRNPLQAVLALAESIAEDADLARIHEDAEEIAAAAQRIAGIVDDLSGYARAGGGGGSSTIELSEVLRRALRMVRHGRRMNGIEVVEAYAPGCAVRGVASELVQVASGLINNALDAMDGDGTLTLGAGQTDGEIWLRVSDTGCGMDEVTQGQIFEPFFTKKSEAGRNGLGLYVGRQILEAHGARVDLESAPGSGSTFLVCFPSGGS